MPLADTIRVMNQRLLPGPSALATKRRVEVGGCPQTYRLQVPWLSLTGPGGEQGVESESLPTPQRQRQTDPKEQRHRGTERELVMGGGQRGQDRAQDRQNIKRGGREGNETERERD